VSAVRAVLGFIRPYWALSVLSIGAVSLFSLVDLFGPYATGQLLNLLADRPLDPLCSRALAAFARLSGQTADPELAVNVLLAGIFLTTVGRAPLQPWLGHWFHWDIAFRARRDHLRRALARLLGLPLEYFDRNNPGRIAGVVARGISNSTWTYPDVAGSLVPKCVRVLGIFAVLVALDWRVGGVFLGSFVGLMVLTWRTLRRINRAEDLLDRHVERTESRTSELITNIKTVKAFAGEERALRLQAERFEREFRLVDYRIHRGYVRLNAIRTTVIQVCVFGLLCYALRAAMAGEMSPGHFVTVFTLVGMAYAELGPMGDVAENLARRFASMARFQQFLTTPAGPDEVRLLAGPTAPPPTYRFAGKIEFADLRFAYEPGRAVIEDFNLCIQPCQTVALVGRSGSGKSTLVKLLFRYFEPTDGAIKIDGDDIRDLDVAAYRRRLAIVHQDVDLFNGTIYENLLYGNPGASCAQVREACRIARVDDFVRELPDGYATVVGERGMRLSGGQRQRLGIARALVADPDVLVFDEATSSLDYESERAIQLAMQGLLGTRTVIIIAHRLSTVRDADRIVVLDNGRIAEAGTHGELLDRDGLYHRLHALQAN